jgi:uncharacterized protein
MTVAVPIYQGQDFYAPTFEVRQRDQRRALPANVIRDMTEVTYRDNLEQIDTYQLTLNNWDADKLTFKYSDGNDFLPGKELELWMGYHGQDPLRRMITGPITSMQPSFPASGQPTMAIQGRNLLHALQTDKRSFAYRKMTDSQVARAIGTRLRITVRTDRTAEALEERYDYLFQRDQPSILFLLERARRIGYDLYVGELGGERFLYFGPSLDIRPLPYELVYGRSLIEFQPNLDTTDQVGEVAVHGWDDRNKRPIRHTAKRTEVRTQGVGAAGGQRQIEQSFRQTREVITDMPVQTQQEAKTVSTETLERNAKDLLTASGSTVGLPDLVAGTALQLDGLGTRFSGRWFVTSTTHTIGDGGYTTRFECRREEL